ncbi:hypothetical protein EZV62_003242 [Acer yangbiense]|uniref:3-hydroxyisobutyryl-CoA hydrolase n=1 Tax=Acer yangbiense TaxID=1000413 RepID=A0A5C7IG60_9ROSI|nr:hypothetical protein EZV62_003242 [Acer yangbiense]
MDLLDNREVVQVAFQGNSTVKKVILNRPHKLNTLTYEMLSQMMNKLKVYENDSKVRLVILKGTGRAFCAGGDVVALYNFMTPQVALIDGMVMGGGAGVSSSVQDCHREYCACYAGGSNRILCWGNLFPFQTPRISRRIFRAYRSTNRRSGNDCMWVSNSFCLFQGSSAAGKCINRGGSVRNN